MRIHLTRRDKTRSDKTSGNNSVVEYNLAKVGVASSNLVSRSIFSSEIQFRGCISVQHPLKADCIAHMRNMSGNNSVVEYNLAKVGVASSNLVSRSITNLYMVPS